MVTGDAAVACLFVDVCKAILPVRVGGTIMPRARALYQRFSAIVDRQAVTTGMLAVTYTLAISGAVLAADPAGRVDKAEGQSTGLLEGSVRMLSTNAEIFLQELVQTQAGARLALGLGPRT